MTSLPITLHQMLTGKWLWKCVSMGAWGLSSDQTCEFRVLVIPRLLNVASSVNKTFVWSCWFPNSQWQNSTRAMWLLQMKVMNDASHLHPASTNSFGYPSDCSCWTALNNFQYSPLEIDTASQRSFTSRFGDVLLTLQIPVHIAIDLPTWYSKFRKPPLIFDCC
jgi:hypothetical protein